jgi:hypothetical protein
MRYTNQLVDAGIAPSVGSGDSYNNALAESIIRLFKTEVTQWKGPWRCELLSLMPRGPARRHARLLARRRDRRLPARAMRTPRVDPQAARRPPAR